MGLVFATPYPMFSSCVRQMRRRESGTRSRNPGETYRTFVSAGGSWTPTGEGCCEAQPTERCEPSDLRGPVTCYYHVLRPACSPVSAKLDLRAGEDRVRGGWRSAPCSPLTSSAQAILPSPAPIPASRLHARWKGETLRNEEFLYVVFDPIRATGEPARASFSHLIILS